MNHLLDNIVWHALCGPQKKFSVGAEDIRRFAPGFSPIIGFAEADNPNFDALVPFCEPGEHFYCGEWSGPAPKGWQIEEESTMFRMIWGGSMLAAEDADGAVQLGPEHSAQALELATLTRPGPFGLRTIELGDYFGFFEGERLVAMGGERFYAGSFREISGVCTHPDFQGRGFARRLMNKLIRRQIQRNETPFLHVMRDNSVTHDLYKRMSFRDYCETVVRVISRG
jgi:ribosomal protein S18 acetylase RimI-like enzyme